MGFGADRILNKPFYLVTHGIDLDKLLFRFIVCSNDLVAAA